MHVHVRACSHHSSIVHWLLPVTSCKAQVCLRSKISWASESIWEREINCQCVRLLIAPTILPLSTVCIRSRHARHAGVPSIKDQWASEREISCEFDHTESSERSETVRVGSERFFSLSLERQRSAGEMASFGTYSPPFVLDRQQKFWKSAARLDRYVEFTTALKWGTTDKQSPN